MKESLAAKYAISRADEASQNGTDLEDSQDDYGAFGFLRGVRDRALFLELRLKDGNIRAIGYAWIEGIDFDRSEGLLLHVAGQRIRIKGRNLDAEVQPNITLLKGLTRHRVPYIQEADNAMAMKTSGQSILVESIDWEHDRRL